MARTEKLTEGSLSSRTGCVCGGGGVVAWAGERVRVRVCGCRRRRQRSPRTLGDGGGGVGWGQRGRGALMALAAGMRRDRRESRRVGVPKSGRAGGRRESSRGMPVRDPPRAGPQLRQNSSCFFRFLLSYSLFDLSWTRTVYRWQ